MTEQEIRIARQSLHALDQWVTQVFGGLQAIKPLLAVVETAEKRIAEAQVAVDASREAVERDQKLVASLQPQLEKARAMQGAVRDLEKQVAALEAKKVRIEGELHQLKLNVTRAMESATAE